MSRILKSNKKVQVFTEEHKPEYMANIELEPDVPDDYKPQDVDGTFYLEQNNKYFIEIDLKHVVFKDKNDVNVEINPQLEETVKPDVSTSMELEPVLIDEVKLQDLEFIPDSNQNIEHSVIMNVELEPLVMEHTKKPKTVHFDFDSEEVVSYKAVMNVELQPVAITEEKPHELEVSSVSGISEINIKRELVADIELEPVVVEEPKSGEVYVVLNLDDAAKASVVQDDLEATDVDKQTLKDMELSSELGDGIIPEETVLDEVVPAALYEPNLEQQQESSDISEEHKPEYIISIGLEPDVPDYYKPQAVDRAFHLEQKNKDFIEIELKHVVFKDKNDVNLEISPQLEETVKPGVSTSIELEPVLIDEVKLQDMEFIPDLNQYIKHSVIMNVELEPLVMEDTKKPETVALDSDSEEVVSYETVMDVELQPVVITEEKPHDLELSSVSGISEINIKRELVADIELEPVVIEEPKPDPEEVHVVVNLDDAAKASVVQDDLEATDVDKQTLKDMELSSELGDGIILEETVLDEVVPAALYETNLEEQQESSDISEEHKPEYMVSIELEPDVPDDYKSQDVDRTFYLEQNNKAFIEIEVKHVGFKDKNDVNVEINPQLEETVKPGVSTSMELEPVLIDEVKLQDFESIPDLNQNIEHSVIVNVELEPLVMKDAKKPETFAC